MAGTCSQVHLGPKLPPNALTTIFTLLMRFEEPHSIWQKEIRTGVKRFLHFHLTQSPVISVIISNVNNQSTHSRSPSHELSPMIFALLGSV